MINKKYLPEFNPKISGEFAADILEKLNIKGILIGRLAVWAWLSENSEKQSYTKDIDIAVSKDSLFEIRRYFQKKDYKLRELQIGGINVKDEKDINVDFIDRSSIEWADYSSLFTEAIHESFKSKREITVGNKNLYLVSVEYLIAMKLATCEKKDEDDTKVLLKEIDNIDFQSLRIILSKYLGSSGRTRFEIILRDIGHNASRLVSYQKES